LNIGVLYRRQIYQIAESNRIESKLFFARIGMLYDAATTTTQQIAGWMQQHCSR